MAAAMLLISRRAGVLANNGLAEQSLSANHEGLTLIFD
jgi:hypothetical protein